MVDMLNLQVADIWLDNSSRRGGAVGICRRALVHSNNDVLTINYGSDYTGGVNIQGNVGIGTTSLSEKLEVIGNINSEGKLKENGHDLIPVGTIVMWNGAIAPNGWALCDGTGTYNDINGIQQNIPNLSGRFIMGQGESYSVGQIGGAEEVRLVTSEMPAHYQFIVIIIQAQMAITGMSIGIRDTMVMMRVMTLMIDVMQKMKLINSTEIQGYAGNHSHEVSGGAEFVNRWRWSARKQNPLLCIGLYYQKYTNVVEVEE